MSQKIINVGVVANDGTGDTLRTGAGKINDNFTELYSLTNTYVTNSNLTTSLASYVTNSSLATSLFPYATTTSLNSLIPNQSSNSGKFLTTNGAVLSWTTVTGSGTVTSASVVSANGFAGTVATGSTTPAITISTSISGILKGNGTAISSATSGTDYAPGTSALATGIIKSTTTTGALTIAVSGTDYQAPIGTISGLVKGNGANALIAAVSGTDYQAPIGTISGVVKGNGTNALTSAVAGTDYQAPIGTITGLVKGNGANALIAAVSGTDYQAPLPTQSGQTGKYLTTNGTTLSWGTVSGSGTVTTVSVVSANGFTGTVATASSTPAITVTTSITGVLKGNGTAISAAVSGTDYQAPLPSQTGNSAKFLTTDGSSLSWGTVSGLPSRTTRASTTASLAANAAGNITISGFKSYMLLSIQTSAAAWVTVYATSAARSADTGRTITTDPTPGSGVLAEIITTGSQTQLFSPAVLGFSDETSPSTDIQVKVVNRSGSTTTITVTMKLVQLEV